MLTNFSMVPWARSQLTGPRRCRRVRHRDQYRRELRAGEGTRTGNGNGTPTATGLEQHGDPARLILSQGPLSRAPGCLRGHDGPARRRARRRPISQREGRSSRSETASKRRRAASRIPGQGGEQGETLRCDTSTATWACRWIRMCR